MLSTRAQVRARSSMFRVVGPGEHLISGSSRTRPWQLSLGTFEVSKAVREL